MRIPYFQPNYPQKSESCLSYLFNRPLEVLGCVTGSSRQINSLLKSIQNSPKNQTLLTKLHDAVQLGHSLDTKSAAIRAETLLNTQLTGQSKNVACKAMRTAYNISFLDKYKKESIAVLGITALIANFYLKKTPSLSTRLWSWGVQRLESVEQITSSMASGGIPFVINGLLRSALLHLVLIQNHKCALTAGFLWSHFRP